MPRNKTVVEEETGSSTDRTIGIDGLIADGDEQPFRDFMSEFFAAAAMMQNLRRTTARAFGLTSSELAVLVAVAKLTPPPSIRRIADHLRVAPPNVTADAGKLVKSGLLSKMADDKDGRATRIELTQKGRQLNEAIYPALRAVNDRIFSELSREDLALMIRLFNRVMIEGSYILSQGRS